MPIALVLCLALMACDQGARPAAAPPVRDAGSALVIVDAPGITITSTEDFVTRGTAFLDAFFALWNTDDCERVGAGLEQLLSSNKVLVDAMMAYSKAHPEAEKALSEKMQSRITQMMSQLQPSFTRCMSHPRVVKAVEAFQQAERTDIAR